jgi:hypothetical protein
MNVDALMNDSFVQRVINSDCRIESTDVLEFSDQVAQYIDSYPIAGRQACWPLVKKATIYINNSILRFGIALVDLPGSADTNMARVLQTKRYLNKCKALWIVSDITRAKTDKDAKEYLSEAVQMDLLLDRFYNAVTFVCTKTDSVDCDDIAQRLMSNAQKEEYLANQMEAQKLRRSKYL